MNALLLLLIAAASAQSIATLQGASTFFTGPGFGTSVPGPNPALTLGQAYQVRCTWTANPVSPPATLPTGESVTLGGVLAIAPGSNMVGSDFAAGFPGGLSFINGETVPDFDTTNIQTYTFTAGGAAGGVCNTVTSNTLSSQATVFGNGLVSVTACGFSFTVSAKTCTTE